MLSLETQSFGLTTAGIIWENVKKKAPWEPHRFPFLPPLLLWQVRGSNYRCLPERGLRSEWWLWRFQVPSAICSIGFPWFVLWVEFKSKQQILTLEWTTSISRLWCSWQCLRRWLARHVTEGAACESKDFSQDLQRLMCLLLMGKEFWYRLLETWGFSISRHSVTNSLQDHLEWGWCLLPRAIFSYTWQSSGWKGITSQDDGSDDPADPPFTKRWPSEAEPAPPDKGARGCLWPEATFAVSDGTQMLEARGEFPRRIKPCSVLRLGTLKLFGWSPLDTIVGRFVSSPSTQFLQFLRSAVKLQNMHRYQGFGTSFSVPLFSISPLFPTAAPL